MMGVLERVSITNPMELSAVAGALGSMTQDTDDLSSESQVKYQRNHDMTFYLLELFLNPP